MNKKKLLCILGGAAAVCVIIGGTIWLISANQKTEEVVYRETTVEYGNLTVGITEDSTVNIGTLEQTFDLDISALVSSDSSSTQNSMGNAGMMGMQFSLTGSNSFTSEAQEMEVEEVHITVGQQIQEGDVLYTLTQESVDEIRTQLEEDVTDTLAEYQSLQTSQQASRLVAQQGYDTYVSNGSLAQLVYDKTVAQLQEALELAQEEVLEAQNQVNENLLELVSLQEDYTQAQQDLKDAQAAVSENYENRYNDPYYYTVYKNTCEMAQKIVDNLEEKIEELTKENETLLTQIEEKTRTMNQTARELELQTLSAGQTLETDQYYASAASEWYQIQTASLDSELETAYNSYEAAVEKLAKFDSYIVDNQVIAEYSGVVTEVPLTEGDTVTRNTGLLTLYDQEEVTMDVTLSESDYTAIDQSGNVNITYTAYPDAIYTGVISEVSDATYDSSSGEIYYTITVTIQGDVTGLYEGMTGDVTFVTNEIREVIYVSNRAIIRDGAHSYVKVRDENGDIVRKEVVTGFSDGVNAEIVEGLSEGDVVLIESKVSES